MSKKLLIIITVIFFTAMLFLSFFARTIHSSVLPNVEIGKVTQVDFSFTYLNENGNLQKGTHKRIAVTAEQYKNGVFVVYKDLKNGEVRNFVRLASIVIGVENNGYYEVVSGLNYSDVIVKKSNKDLFDGCEVTLL